MSATPPPKDPAVALDRSVQQLFPTADQLPEAMPTTEEGRKRWLIEIVVNWIVLILAITNLTVVLFDATYLSFRHHYQNARVIGAKQIGLGEKRLRKEDRGTPQHFKVLPDLVAFYDPIRGIEPHRDTDDYLRAGREAFALLPGNPEAAEKKLDELVKTGKEKLISANPYRDQGLTGVHEQLKTAMKEHMAPAMTAKALASFWSTKHLKPGQVEEERAWFDEKLVPSLATHYPPAVVAAYKAAAEKAFQLAATTPTHPDARAALAAMVQASQEKLIDASPYQGADLAKPFGPLLLHMDMDSTTKSFKLFWSKGYLLADKKVQLPAPWWSPWAPAQEVSHFEAERRWFERDVAPLLARNYYQTYNRSGNPDNVFWKIDIALSIPILVEFLLRGLIGVRLGTYESMKAFFALRWYDAVYAVPLFIYFLPAIFQGPVHLLRCISVGYRMQRLGLINPVAIVQKRIAKTLDIITDLVNVKLLSNYQDSVRKMDMAAALQSMPPQQRAQLEKLIEKNLIMVVGHVLPDILPQVEEIIARSVHQALEQSPAYQQFRRLPAVGLLPEKLIPTIIAETLAGTQVTALKAIGDPENIRLTGAIVDATIKSLIIHMAEFGTEAEVKALVIEALEDEKRKVLAD